MEWQDKINISKARLFKAKDFLNEAEFTLNGKKYSAAANRSYYAAYTAIRALLCLEYEEQIKHSGNISLFRRYYIHGKVFPVEFSKYVGALFDVRQRSDYDSLYVISKEEVSTQFENAKEIVEAIEVYLQNKYAE